MYSEIAGHSLGHSKRKPEPAPKAKKMHISKAEGGKFVAHHSETGQDHVMDNIQALHDHIDQNMGEEADEQ